jgi:hypothetical protein
MSLFDYISERLFPSGKKVSIHETLQRPQKFIDGYEVWLKSPQFLSLRKDLIKSWAYQLNNMRSPVDMMVYTSGHANGFTVYPEYQGGMVPLSYFMEYIKDRLLQESYRLVHADRKTEGRNNYIEVIERYHLKPRLPDTSPIDQMYGNVHLELLKQDKNEARLKFLVTVYSDRNYTVPRDFNDLMSLLFDY